MTGMTKERVQELLDGTTPGPWSGYNMVNEEGRQMTPEEIGEYVCNSVKKGATDRFLFVSGKHDDGGDCDICHTGNGPRGPANTALIAAAPDLARAYLDTLAALEAARAENEALRKDKDEAVRCALMRRERLDVAEAELTALRASLAQAEAQVKALREERDVAREALHVSKHQSAEIMAALTASDASNGREG